MMLPSIAIIGTLFAQTQVELPPVIEYSPIVSGGAVAAMVGLVVWLVTKQGPAERLEARNHMDRVIATVGDRFEKMQTMYHQDQVELNVVLREIAGNCARHLAQITQDKTP